MNMIRRIAAFLAALADGLVSGLFRSLFETLTGRNLQAEEAERQDAEERQLAAQTVEAEVEARHREQLAAIAEQTQVAREAWERMAVMEERRERQARYAQSHEDDMSIRSHGRRRPDPEPEDGAPMCPVPV